MDFLTCLGKCLCWKLDVNFYYHSVVSSLGILSSTTAQLQLKLRLVGVLFGDIEGSFIRELSDTRRNAS